MKHTFLFAFCLLICSAGWSQVGYKIPDARTVKMGYKPFPKDMALAELKWTDLEASCIDDLMYGAWFELKVKSTQAKFTVHTGGKMGTISNPIIYLGKVEETRMGTRLTEVCCVAHSGDDGEFSLECTDLVPKGEYFVLVSSNQERARFGISSTDEFDPSTSESPSEEQVASLSRIFGKVIDASGEGVGNVEVSLLDEAQQKIASSKTDDRGVFNFEKLQPEKIYLTRVEEDDTELQVEMFLIDDKGSIKSRATRIGDQLYGFGIDKSLAPFIKLLAPKNYALNLNSGQKGIVGKVVDRKTYLFGRSGIEVGLYNKQRKLMKSSVTDEDGLFSFVVNEGDDYDVKVTSDQEKDFAEVVIVDELSVPTKVANSDDLGNDGFFSFSSLPKEVVALKRMEIEDTQLKMPSDFGDMSSGESIVLQNILFASGSADLLPSSYAELDRLAAELEKKSALRIEVSGHTDDQGTQGTNIILSENRAKAVVDYLIDQGIVPSRLEYKGYGEQKPMADNATEEGRRINRRVEFKVLK